MRSKCPPSTRRPPTSRPPDTSSTTILRGCTRPLSTGQLDPDRSGDSGRRLHPVVRRTTSGGPALCRNRTWGFPVMEWRRGLAPFKLNLPVTPITDLRVHQGDLIAATSRSILLDSGRSGADPAVPGGHRRSRCSSQALRCWPTAEASSTHRTEGHRASTSRGVNPANGIVIYYQFRDSHGRGRSDSGDRRRRREAGANHCVTEAGRRHDLGWRRC